MPKSLHTNSNFEIMKEVLEIAKTVAIVAAGTIAGLVIKEKFLKNL